MNEAASAPVVSATCGETPDAFRTVAFPRTGQPPAEASKRRESV
jgi:hypothetical protein